MDNWSTARIARAVGVNSPLIDRLLWERGFLWRTHLSASRYLAAERTEAERRAYTAAARVARQDASLDKK